MGLISNGTTLLDAGSISVTAGALVLIKTLTASVSDDLTFLNGSSDVVFDSTYKEYIFKLISNHPYANPGIISFQATTDGTNYNTTVTSTYLRAYHDEGDSSAALQYATGFDQAQGTAIQGLDSGSGNDNDQASSGLLRVFDPSNTTFVKHFIATNNAIDEGDGSRNNFVAGYANTTSAVDAVQFKFASDEIQAGTITLYGIN